jgi:hypothetical protein
MAAPIGDKQRLCSIKAFPANDLNWNIHICEICKKASKTMYLLFQLKRCGASIAHKLIAYQSYVRPILEYASVVWHPGISKTQSNMIEDLQNRAIKLILPATELEEARSQLKLDKLWDRREAACKKLFNKMIIDEEHRLYNLLPPPGSGDTNLRNQRKYESCIARTNRPGCSFINYGIKNFQ